MSKKLKEQKQQEQQEILKNIIELVNNQGIKVKKMIIARQDIPKNLKFFSLFIDLTYQLGKLNKNDLLPDNNITYDRESWHDLILFFKYHHFNPNTLHYHLLRYVAYSLKDLCIKYSTKFMYKLFFTLEEHSVTGLYKIPKKSNFYKYIHDNYGDIKEPHLISNTHIIAMINKLYPKLHNKRKKINTNKNTKKFKKLRLNPLKRTRASKKIK